MINNEIHHNFSRILLIRVHVSFFWMEFRNSTLYQLFTFSNAKIIRGGLVRNNKSANHQTC